MKDKIKIFVYKTLWMFFKWLDYRSHGWMWTYHKKYAEARRTCDEKR